jgi:hypothetical protein
VGLHLATVLAMAGWFWIAGACAQTPAPAARVRETGLSANRILGVIPNFQTVDDGSPAAMPLTAGQKWLLFAKETVDPFNFVSAALGSGSSQMGNRTPKYGEGGDAYGERFGAAMADLATQNFFSAGVLACLLHQDPRYFRKGPQAGFMKRVAYSVSRVAVTRKDTGEATFNSSGVFGMMLGIGASNLYYPAPSMRATVMAGRLESSLMGGVIGNLMSEFWPDIQQKFFHRRHKSQP